MIGNAKHRIYLHEKKWQSWRQINHLYIKNNFIQKWFFHLYSTVSACMCCCVVSFSWKLYVFAHCPQKCTFQHFTEVLPGLLMYMWMGLLLLSDCRKSSWAITRLATESSIWAEENEQQHKSLWKHVEEKNVIQSQHPGRHLLDPLHKWFSLSGGENRCHTLFLLSPEEKKKRQNCLLKRKNNQFNNLELWEPEKLHTHLPLV